MTYEQRQKQNKLIWGLLFFGIIAVLVFSFVSHKGRKRSVVGIPDPIQTKTEGSVKMEIDGYHTTINFQYAYQIEALVISTKEYSTGNLGGKLAPKDLALAWGKVAEYNTRIDFHWRQANRWYSWRINGDADISKVGGVSGIEQHSCNNHLIAADDMVKKTIKKIRTGDHIRLTGYLVNVDAKKDDGSTFWWNSSTTREDTGDGSCELIYVTKAEILD